MVNNDVEQIGAILVKSGKLNPEDLEIAIMEHKKTGTRLGEVLVKMSFVSENDVQQALSKQLNIPFIRLGGIEIDKSILERVPAKLVTHYNIFPIEQKNGVLKIAMTDPLDLHTLDNVRMHLKLDIEPVISTSEDIKEAIQKYYGIGADTIEDLMDDKEKKGEIVDIEGIKTEDIEEMAEDASIIRFVNQIIAEAISDNATDIHVEPFEKDLRIRYRIDGLLYEAAIPPTIKQFQSSIISRIKVMSDLDIAERRLPQDGRIKIKMSDNEYDLRVSTIPTPYGESVGIRILNRDTSFIEMHNLGLDDDHLRIMFRLIQKPHGIILVTGPTGSGKSTTLYACLSTINKIDRKIITIEDPIEFRLSGVTQIQVQPKIGLTFAHCLRNILRHDPDIIMVGEIRDQETAQITIRTALTGHLVFSTLHTNDAPSAVTRLLDMGIEPFLVASSVESMIAQRLIRKICPKCRTEYAPLEDVIKRINVTNEPINNMKFYKGHGCEECRYTGYKGRTAIFEVVLMTEPLKRLVVERASSNRIKEEAIKEGMRNLRFDGWKKVKAGITTIDEVLRMTQEQDIEDLSHAYE